MKALSESAFIKNTETRPSRQLTNVTFRRLSSGVLVALFSLAKLVLIQGCDILVGLIEGFAIMRFA
jgi:hypothetical protein